MEKEFEALSNERMMLECLMGFGAADPERTVKAARELARRGSTNLKAGNGDYSALHLVLMGRVPNSGADEAALELLAAGASPTARTRHGVSPLMLAMQTGSVSVVEALLRRGASTEERDCQGMGPFGHLSLFGSKAVAGERERCAYLALAAGGNPREEVDSEGRSSEDRLKEEGRESILSVVRAFEEREKLSDNVEEAFKRKTKRKL